MIQKDGTINQSAFNKSVNTHLKRRLSTAITGLTTVQKVRTQTTLLLCHGWRVGVPEQLSTPIRIQARCVYRMREVPFSAFTSRTYASQSAEESEAKALEKHGEMVKEAAEVMNMFEHALTFFVRNRAPHMCHSALSDEK